MGGDREKMSDKDISQIKVFNMLHSLGLCIFIFAPASGTGGPYMLTLPDGAIEYDIISASV